MSADQDEIKELPPGEAFRRAKIEHFLDHARECVEMGRYLTSIKKLDAVFQLDSANEEAKALRSTIDEALSRMLHRRGNGQPVKSSDDPPVGRPRRADLVMVVDQDERLLVSLTGTLRRYGFMAIGASSVEEAIEAFSMVKPDVVISEVNFESGSRGFDLYLWLKTNSGNQDIPFLFLATRLDRDTLIAGKRFGVDDLIIKPVDDDVVIASVINCLSRRKALTHS